jgi:hypothetical protein
VLLLRNSKTLAGKNARVFFIYVVVFKRYLGAFKGNTRAETSAGAGVHRTREGSLDSLVLLSTHAYWGSRIALTFQRTTDASVKRAGTMGGNPGHPAEGPYRPTSDCSHVNFCHIPPLLKIFL